MSSRGRTFSFVLTLLSLTNGLVSSQLLPGKFPVWSELGANINGPYFFPKATSTSDLLAAAQRLLPSSQQVNEVIAQPVITESPIEVGNTYSQSIINVNPSIPVANVQTPYNTAYPVLASEVLLEETITTVPQVTTSQIEYAGVIDPNYVPLGPLPTNLIPQSLPPSETIYVDNYFQYPELPQTYETPVTVQVPSMPVFSPFIAVATPVPGMLPQNIPSEMYTSSILSEASLVEVPSLLTSANLFESYGQQLPLNLQINVPSPSCEQPIILISSPSPTPVYQDYNSLSSSVPALPPVIPPPIIVTGSKSRSKWRSLLPILLIALCDGGCSNNGGSCGCSSGCNIPIPYPIPIPTNNPIILGRGKGKRKTPTDSGDVE